MNYTTFTNFSMKYLVMWKVYMNYLHIQADNPWYNYYLHILINWEWEKPLV